MKYKTSHHSITPSRFCIMHHGIVRGRKKDTRGVDIYESNFSEHMVASPPVISSSPNFLSHRPNCPFHLSLYSVVKRKVMEKSLSFSV